MVLPSHGFVDFAHSFRPHQRGAGVFYNNKAAVARTVIEVPQEMTVDFRLAWDDQLILRVNNDPTVDMGQQDAFRPKSVSVKLHKGGNTIMIKLSNTRGSNHGAWVFNLRATTPEGTILVPKHPGGTVPK